MYKKLASADGSFTFYSERFKECYHSLKDGALTETLHKHVLPPIELLGILQRQEVRILDLCFGLGYNSFVTAWIYKKYCFSGKVVIFSTEIDSAILDKISMIDFPPELSFLEKERIIQQLKISGQSQLSPCVDLKLMLGDGIAILQKLSKDTNKYFDIIYHDAFSLQATPEFWSEEFFQILYQLLDEKGIITTYSVNKNILKNARDAGFFTFIYTQDKCRNSTILSKKDLSSHQKLKLIL